MRRIGLLFFVLMLFSLNVIKAQTESTLPFLRRTNQSTFINPAFIPKYRTSIGLPMPGVSNFNLNFNLRGFDISTITKAIDNDTSLNLNKLADNINTEAFGFNTFMQTDLFHLCFPIGKYQVGLNVSNRISSFIEIDKDFFLFLTGGNQALMGRKADFTGMSVNANVYNEIGVSVAREFEKFSVGIRGKYLSGIVYASTDNLSASFTSGVNPYDPVNIQLGGQIKTAGLVPFLLDSINGVAATDEQKDINAFVKDVNSYTGNKGGAIDIGFTYWATPRLNLHASIIDLGFINWQVNPYAYTFDDVDITFSGLSYEQLNNADVRQKYLDSLSNLIKDATVSQGSFTSWLPMRFFMGGDYDLTFRDKVGVMVQGQYFNKQIRPAFSIAYSRKIGTNWDITTNYSYFNGSFANIGLGTAVKWGACQLFFVQDNILASLFPANSRSFYVRFGFNLVWGEPHSRPIRVD